MTTLFFNANMRKRSLIGILSLQSWMTMGRQPSCCQSSSCRRGSASQLRSTGSTLWSMVHHWRPRCLLGRSSTSSMVLGVLHMPLQSGPSRGLRRKKFLTYNLTSCLKMLLLFFFFIITTKTNHSAWPCRPS